MILNSDPENKYVFEYKNEDGKKVSKLATTYFTATYGSLMKTNKSKFKMRESDQVEMFWKSCFIYVIQLLFSYVILAYGGFKASVERPPELHFTMFFTVLILHFTCMPVARDGLAMMKYALLHHDEFDHPISAFMLGFFNLSEMTFAMIVNIASNQSKNKVDVAIASFIGFKLIIDLPTIYMGGIEDFPQKGAVGKLE